MKNTLLLIVLVLFYSCASKKLASEEEIAIFKDAVENNKIKFEASSANPIGFANVRGIENLLPPGSSMANINLASNANHLIIKNDSINLHMPYFGENQLSTGYNTRDVGYILKDKPTKEKINYNSKKQEYNLNYSVKNNEEFLQLFLTLFPNKTARLDINSSHRTSIFYYGKWEVIE